MRRPDALQKALKLLAARQRTEQELRKALQAFPQAEVDSALARAKELGYINDRETARARARTRVGQGEAPRLAAKRLAAQGIAAADARAAAGEAAEGAGDDELAARALYRRLRGRKPADGAGEAAPLAGADREGPPPLCGGEGAGHHLGRRR